MFRKGSLLYREVSAPFLPPSLKALPASFPREACSTNVLSSCKQLRMETPKKALPTSPQPSADEETDNPMTAAPGQMKRKTAPPISNNIVIEHTDMIKNKFWEGKPWLLSS